jgi:hypothetical protein
MNDVKKLYLEHPHQKIKKDALGAHRIDVVNKTMGCQQM